MAPVAVSSHGIVGDDRQSDVSTAPGTPLGLSRSSRTRSR